MQHQEQPYVKQADIISLHSETVKNFPETPEDLNKQINILQEDQDILIDVFVSPNVKTNKNISEDKYKEYWENIMKLQDEIEELAQKRKKLERKKFSPQEFEELEEARTTMQQEKDIARFDEFVFSQPKRMQIIYDSLKGADIPVAWSMRRRLLDFADSVQDVRVVSDIFTTFAGLDTKDAWNLREKFFQSYPGAVNENMEGLEKSSKFKNLHERHEMFRNIH